MGGAGQGGGVGRGGVFLGPKVYLICSIIIHESTSEPLKNQIRLLEYICHHFCSGIGDRLGVAFTAMGGGGGCK